MMLIRFVVIFMSHDSFMGAGGRHINPKPQTLNPKSYRTSFKPFKD